jgi:hypothetical protein
MRFPAMLFLLLSITGCGGTVVFTNRNGGTVPPPPRRVPAPETCEDSVTRQQAVDIALGEAARQHCRYLQVRDVDSSRNHWTIEIVARNGDHRRVDIRVKVDRRNGAIVYYKEKLEKKNKHDHHHDDD